MSVPEPDSAPPSTIHAKYATTPNRRTRKPSPNKRLARDVVIASRAAGMSVQECARTAGVSVTTAQRYVTEAKKTHADLSRESVISMLSLRLASPGMPEQYIAPLVAILSKLKGWTERDQRTETVRPIGDLFASWCAELAQSPAVNVGAPTSIAQLTPGTDIASADSRASSVPETDVAGEPPIAGADESVKSSPPPPTKF